MVRWIASCPGCGGEVRFDVGASVMSVCPRCRSAVARSGTTVEDLGKVAELAETRSPLSLGLKGAYGVTFRLTGRIQLKHPSGAVWDEWFATFGSRRTGWLAEAQGRYYLTFPAKFGRDVPPLETLRAGDAIDGVYLVGRLVVNEVNRATFVAAEGEIPFRIEPGKEYGFADLSGERGTFATLDYRTDPPAFFLGKELTLEQLGIQPLTPAQAVVEKPAEALKVACPKCGGRLELRAPDRSRRVGCPFCGSLLDATKGELSFLRALEPSSFEPVLPLGSTGTFEGVPQAVIGFLVRSTVIEGERYYWQEYLLYHPKVGFRWLVSSDDHWTYVRAIDPGAVREEAGEAVYRGIRFREYQRGKGRVEHVRGEVYWEVSVGEEVRMVDYSAPPEMLSKEVTIISSPGKKGRGLLGEVNWSHGEYVEPDEIESKFGLRRRLPRPTEDHPCRRKSVGLKNPVLLVVVLLAILLVIWIISEVNDEGGSNSSGGHGSHVHGIFFGGK